jgi:hypothetical protein
MNATPSSQSQSTNTMGFQAQMLVMLNDTFSKLSSAITDNKNESKSERPKFCFVVFGDHGSYFFTSLARSL